MLSLSPGFQPELLSYLFGSILTVSWRGLAAIALVAVVVVLVNALLVIPAATAKLLARSLGQMFVLAPLLGIGSVLAGLVVSSWVDAPSGPAIVVIAGLLFLAAWGRVAWRARGRSGRAPA